MASTALAPSTAVPSLVELNGKLDNVRSLESQLSTGLDHMSKVLKKMMKSGQWRKEWNRALGKDSLPKSEQKALQVELVSKIQAVRHEMAFVRPRNRAVRLA
jgi:hypothetical protein